MKITVSVIKADVGGIGGHTRPSDNLIQAVRDTVNASADLLIDHYIGYCGGLITNGASDIDEIEKACKL